MKFVWFNYNACVQYTMLYKTKIYRKTILDRTVYGIDPDATIWFDSMKSLLKLLDL